MISTEILISARTSAVDDIQQISVLYQHQNYYFVPINSLCEVIPI